MNAPFIFLDVPGNPVLGHAVIHDSKGNPLWSKPAEAHRLVASSKPLPFLYRAIVTEIADVSVRSEWGSVFSTDDPTCREQAEAYLRSFDLVDHEWFRGPGSKMFDAPMVDWLPKGWYVLVPQDRDYLGRVWVGPRSRACLVHNPMRAIAIIRRSPHAAGVATGNPATDELVG